MVSRFWQQFNVVTKEHFYHNGGKTENRHAMVEAMVFNFDLQEKVEVAVPHRQFELFAGIP